MRSDRYFKLSVFDIPKRMNVAEWACENRYMDSTSAMFSFDQTPFFYEPSTYMSDIAGTAGIILKTPAQVGKTTAIENMFGWICCFDRANTMLVLDTAKSGQKMSKNRIRPFLRDVCGINNPRNTKKNPDKSNSVSNIGLGRGANLMICSAKSASDLRSTPCKYLLMDELDAWPDELKGEGDPVRLALQRQMRFRGMAVMTSTPTGYEGRIMQQYLIGTQQTWGVVCECGQFMDVRYDDIDFSGSIPVISCPKCGTVYSETDIKNLRHCYSGEKNKAPLKDDFGRVWRSYEVFGTLCHSFYSWEGLKRQELASLSLGEASYQSFRNTTLGETYKPKDDIEIQIPELMRLSASNYTTEKIPSDVAFIVMGIDTHDSCLYCETCGFSDDLKRVYGISYDVLVGDPDEPEVWKQFEELFNRVYILDDGLKMRPVFAFCDSGGHRTNAVYIQSFRNKRFMPIKGFVSNSKTNPDPLLGRQAKLKLNAGIKGKCTVQFLGVNAGKDALAQMELLTITGEKRLYFPKGNGYDAEYFSGLLSEKKINGKWVAPMRGHTNNEPLDCRVYAMACAQYYMDKYYLTGRDGETEMSRKKTMQKKGIDTDTPKESPKEGPKEALKEEPKEEPKEANERSKKFPHM